MSKVVAHSTVVFITSSEWNHLCLFSSSLQQKGSKVLCAVIRLHTRMKSTVAAHLIVNRVNRKWMGFHRWAQSCFLYHSCNQVKTCICRGSCCSCWSFLRRMKKNFFKNIKFLSISGKEVNVFLCQEKKNLLSKNMGLYM